MTPAEIRQAARIFAGQGIHTAAQFFAAFPGKSLREVIRGK